MVGKKLIFHHWFLWCLIFCLSTTTWFSQLQFHFVNSCSSFCLSMSLSSLLAAYRASGADMEGLKCAFFYDFSFSSLASLPSASLFLSFVYFFLVCEQQRHICINNLWEDLSGHVLIANASANVIASAMWAFFLLSHSAAAIDAFVLWFPLSCNKSEEKKLDRTFNFPSCGGRVRSPRWEGGDKASICRISRRGCCRI